MKLFIVNSWDFGSTGRIMLLLASIARQNGFVCYTFSNKWKGRKRNSSQINNPYHIYLGDFFSLALHYLCGRWFGLHGFLSIVSTIKLVLLMELKKCDIVHLHNLHDFSFNFLILFTYLKIKKISVVWTLHDCWNFTGRCPHFVMCKCDKWKDGCHNCSYPKNSYPPSKIDTSRLIWNLKKMWFTGIENCTIVTPSQWLADLVKMSFLKDYPVKVINNGIDLSVFKPTESDFCEKYNLKRKKIVLGVAFGWGIRKGLDVFVELSRRLPVDYQIVLVGTSDAIDGQLPSNIISIHRTQNQRELAEIYTAADVFANPTREEVLGLVNVEALACGTPVVTFKTGGSPECIDEMCGTVVDCDDIDAMEIEIRRICEEKPYSKEACLKRAKTFDMNERYDEYVQLYKDILKNDISK